MDVKKASTDWWKVVLSALAVNSTGYQINIVVGSRSSLVVVAIFLLTVVWKAIEKCLWWVLSQEVKEYMGRFAVADIAISKRLKHGQFSSVM